MQVIAAVVVGGANVLGGYGTVLGTTVGVIFMGVINNGMVLMPIHILSENRSWPDYFDRCFD